MAVIYTESFLEKVRSFGILGYSVEKIIDLVEPDNIEQFITDFENSETANAERTKTVK